MHGQVNDAIKEIEGCPYHVWGYVRVVLGAHPGRLLLECVSRTLSVMNMEQYQPGKLSLMFLFS